MAASSVARRSSYRGLTSPLAATLLGACAVLIVVGIPSAVRVCFGVLAGSVFIAQVSYATVTIGLVIGVLTWAFRFRLARGVAPLRAALEALTLGICALIVTYLVCWSIVPYVPQLAEPNAPNAAVFYVATALADALPIVFVWAVVYLYPRALEVAEERTLEAEVLRREAELLRLRASLEPHFVLNTLNTIAGLVGESPRDARRLLGALGDLFRDAVKDGSPTHTLAEEVLWLTRYAAILEARHPDVVTVRFDVDPSVHDVQVPRLLLQPLVENAVEHGILAREGAGTVSVEARRDGDNLAVVIRDPGPGFAEVRRAGARGLAIVERRLALEGEGAHVTFTREGDFTEVRLRLPITPSPL